MAVAHRDPPPSLRSRVGALFQALHLQGPLGGLKDAAPSTRELPELREYRRAAGLWRHLQAGGYTMIGSRRARALRRMARACDQDDVLGAFVDCGCFNGGSSVMMSSGAPSREVWAFDSFQGLPEAGPRDPDGAADLAGELVASEGKVREAFARLPLQSAFTWSRDGSQRPSPRPLRQSSGLRSSMPTATGTSR